MRLWVVTIFCEMDQQAMRQIMSGNRRGAGTSILRAVLKAASGPYAGVMRLRRWLYRRGLLARGRAGAPVICVGNITTGGTGKTPMVAWIVRKLKAGGRKPAILTRGYKAAGGESDEAELLRQQCGVPVIINADRLAGAAVAAEGADVLVMDDGFQHRRLCRDLDIVLIDAMNPFGYGHCLPRGLLREGPSALRDADAIVITRSDSVADEELQELRQHLGRLAPGASVHLAVHRPTNLISPDGRLLPPCALAGKKVFVFCGLGNPEAFFDTARRLGLELSGRCALDDHVRYDAATAEEICRRARRAGAQVLLTTRKDAQKALAAGFSLPVWQMEVEIEITAGAAELIQELQSAAACHKGCVGGGV